MAKEIPVPFGTRELGADHTVFFPAPCPLSPTNNADTLRDLFTDVATYKKDGKDLPIPHYKRMNMDEKIANFKMLLPSMNYKYYVNGVVYNFNEQTAGHIPRSQWDKVIEENIMVAQDERSMKMKKDILKWLNGTEHSLS